MTDGCQLSGRRFLHVRLRPMHEAAGSALLHASADRWLSPVLFAAEAVEEVSAMTVLLFFVLAGLLGLAVRAYLRESQ